MEEVGNTDSTLENSVSDRNQEDNEVSEILRATSAAAAVRRLVWCVEHSVIHRALLTIKLGNFNVFHAEAASLVGALHCGSLKQRN